MPTTGTHGRTVVVLALLAVLLAGVVVAGCADSGDDQAQPAVYDSTFSYGDFDELPLPPRSEQIGPPAEVQNAVSATYTTDGRRPWDILEFYQRELDDGWDQVETIHEVGDGVWRADWIKDGRRLEVVVAPADHAADAAETVDSPLQFSLILNDDAEANPAEPYFEDSTSTTVADGSGPASAPPTTAPDQTTSTTP